MKRVFFPILFIVYLFLLSCNSSTTLKGFDEKGWKEDKNGCIGKRLKQRKHIEASKDVLIGLSQENVVSLFGSPDVQELYKRNEKFFYYYLQGSSSCDKEVKAISPLFLVIRFNATNKVSSLNFKHSN